MAERMQRRRNAESRLRRLKEVLQLTTEKKRPKLRRRGQRYLPYLPKGAKQQYKEFF